MDIFTSIREDHDRQRKLLDALVDTNGDSDTRRRLFNELKDELTAHAAAEEKFFYVPLICDDDTQDQARHSVSEHHEIEEMIEALESQDFSSPGWLTNAKHLRDRVTHHLDEEEQEVFPMADRSMDDNRVERLGPEFQQEKSAQLH